MGIEQDRYYYNRVYSHPTTQYIKRASELIYAPLWNRISDLIIKNDIEIVIDLGCGPSHFAEILHGYIEWYANMNITYEHKLRHYYGYDFSSTAINMGKERAIPLHLFKIDLKMKDLNVSDFLEGYEKGKTVFTSFEFFEHIHKDLDIIKKIPKGSPIGFSVPPSDTDPGHVRGYPTQKDVIERYSNLIEIHSLKTIKIGHGRHLVWGTKL